MALFLDGDPAECQTSGIVWKAKKTSQNIQIYLESRILIKYIQYYNHISFQKSCLSSFVGIHVDI